MKIEVVAFLSLLLAGLPLAGCGNPSGSEFQKFVQQQNCVTADQIYRDYQRNEVAAQQRYAGQINRVCGIINDIELNWLDEPLISLEAPAWGYVSIGGVDTASAASMARGSFAVFECGAINEVLGDPVLTGCRSAHISISHDREYVADISKLISRQQYAQAKCKMGEGGDKECNLSDSLSAQLRSYGYCWGEEGQYQSDMQWHPCNSTSIQE